MFYKINTTFTLIKEKMSSIFLPLSQHRVHHCQPVWKNLCPLFKEEDSHIRTSSVAQTANDRHRPTALQPCEGVNTSPQMAFPSIITTLHLVKDFFMCRMYLAIFGFFYLISCYTKLRLFLLYRSPLVVGMLMYSESLEDADW